MKLRRDDEGSLRQTPVDEALAFSRNEFEAQVNENEVPEMTCTDFSTNWTDDDLDHVIRSYVGAVMRCCARAVSCRSNLTRTDRSRCT